MIRPKLREVTAMGPAAVQDDTASGEILSGADSALVRGGIGRLGMMPRRARKRRAARIRGGAGAWADAMGRDAAGIDVAGMVLACGAARRDIDPQTGKASAMISENPAPRMHPPGRLLIGAATLHAERSRPKGKPGRGSSGASSET